jgi:hypothetical protein
MKKILLLAMLTISINVFAQEFYYETFENTSLNDYDYFKNTFDWNVEIATPSEVLPDDANKFPTRVQTVDYNNPGKSLKMTVQDNDLTSSDGRTRIEVTKHYPHETATLYHSWNVHIPNDNSFTDYVASNDWHVIAQFHQGNTNNTDCVNDQPVFKMNYIHESNSNSALRNLNMVYGYYKGDGSACGSEGSKHSFTVTDAIEKGAWTKIILKINWSMGSDGYLEMYIDHKPVVAQGTSYVLGQEGATAARFYSRNIHTINGALRNNNLKLGHYRSSTQSGTKTIYVDDYRVTSEMPPKENFTHLTVSNQDLTGTNLVLQCYEVENATNYKFKVVQGGVTKYFDSSTPELDITQSSTWWQPDLSYDVSVRSVVNGVNNSYGDVKTVTTSKFTSLTDEFCGQQLSGNTVVTAYPILKAATYKFRIKKGTSTKYVDSSNSSYDLSSLGSWFDPSAEYIVDVRTILEDGTEFGYGDACTLNPSSSSRMLGEENQAIVDDAFQLKISPNPANDILNISTAWDLPTRLEIYSLSGKLVLTKQFEKNVSLNLAELHIRKGVYVIHAVSGDVSANQRVIIE